MPMAAKEYPEYKYESGAKSGSGSRVLIITILTITILIVGINLFPLLLILMVIPVYLIVKVVQSANQDIIYITDRYMIVGSKVIYFSNINDSKLDKEKSIMTISTVDGNTIQIGASHFPTNARKPEKIAKNKKDKFIKATERISARLKEVSPGTQQS
jgi:hypothetical protein